MSPWAVQDLFSRRKAPVAQSVWVASALGRSFQHLDAAPPQGLGSSVPALPTRWPSRLCTYRRCHHHGQFPSTYPLLHAP